MREEFVAPPFHLLLEKVADGVCDVAQTQKTFHEKKTSKRPSMKGRARIDKMSAGGFCAGTVFDLCSDWEWKLIGGTCIMLKELYALPSRHVEERFARIAQVRKSKAPTLGAGIIRNWPALDRPCPTSKQ